MADSNIRIRRKLKAAHRTFRELKMIAKGLLSMDHTIQVHIIPMRRCNLSCAYCNEYDDHSDPVPIEEMYRRIDKLGALGTSVVTISGGEPLMHPELDDVIGRIRANGMIAGLITNGYLLVAERIKRLNRAGLEWLQISIDNVNPDDVSKKSLKVLDRKLQLLAEYADFHLNINSVVGGGIPHPQDALVIGKRAVALGFTSTIGIIHDGSGQLQPLGEEERGGIGHRLEARPRHLEDAHLGDRAKAVLDRAHDPVVLALLALEVENGVHDVLERLGTCDHALLRDVADKEDGNGAVLREQQELARDLAYLRDAAGRGLELERKDRLHRIDDDRLRPERVDLLDRAYRGQ